MRDGKLDFFKGLLIWSVVLGHCLNVLCPGTILHMVIRTFDLPMFMYISGYLMRGSIVRYNWKQLVVNKVTNIAFPAVVWIAVSLLFGDLHSYYFLWAIFASSVIVCLCVKAGEKVSAHACRGALLLASVVVFHLIPKNIVNMSFLFPFFVIGYYSQNISRVGWKVGIASLALFVCIIAFVWHPDYSVWKSGGYILQNTEYMFKVVSIRLVVGIAGIYSVVFIMGGLYDKAKSSSLMGLFSNIGKQTLAIYMMQHIIVEIWLFNLVEYIGIKESLSNYSALTGYVITPLLSLILLYGMYRVAILMHECKYTKWMFGVRVGVKL